MLILTQWNTKVNVSNFSNTNDVNDPDAVDAPEDIDIGLYSAHRKVSCNRGHHVLYKTLSTGDTTATVTYEPQKMLVRGSQWRWAIVLADLRSCKRDSAYDIFKLNGPDADIGEILSNPYVTICKLKFHVPTYYCPYCDAEWRNTPDLYLQHFHRAVPEWMIWLHQLTMIVQLLIIIEKIRQFLKDLDSDTAKGWIREGKRIWDLISNNSMITARVEKKDPSARIFSDGKGLTVFWIYYIVPPWMKTLCYPLPVFLAD